MNVSKDPTPPRENARTTILKVTCKYFALPLEAFYANSADTMLEHLILVQIIFRNVVV